MAFVSSTAATVSETAAALSVDRLERVSPVAWSPFMISLIFSDEEERCFIASANTFFNAFVP